MHGAGEGTELPLAEGDLSQVHSLCNSVCPSVKWVGMEHFPGLLSMFSKQKGARLVGWLPRGKILAPLGKTVPLAKTAGHPVLQTADLRAGSGAKTDP